MDEMEEIKTAKEASITKVRDAGRRLIVTEGDLYTLLEAGRYGSIVDVKRLAAKVVVIGVERHKEMLLAGKSADGTTSLSRDERDLIRGTIVTAAAAGNSISGLADLLASEFRRINES